MGDDALHGLGVGGLHAGAGGEFGEEGEVGGVEGSGLGGGEFVLEGGAAWIGGALCRGDEDVGGAGVEDYSPVCDISVWLFYFTLFGFRRLTGSEEGFRLGYLHTTVEFYVSYCTVLIPTWKRRNLLT
jgi:hypothetical protein